MTLENWKTSNQPKNDAHQSKIRTVHMEIRITLKKTIMNKNKQK